MAMTRVKRPTLSDLDLSTGKRTRLHRLLYKFGPANGTLLLLPIDQGLEHGPRDFFVNPAAKDPDFQLRLAKEGGFSGIVFQYGIAEKYMSRYAGEVPLVLKLNGKTEIPSDKAPISPCICSRGRRRAAGRRCGGLHALCWVAAAGARLRAVPPGARGCYALWHADDRLGVSAW